MKQNFSALLLSVVFAASSNAATLDFEGVATSGCADGSSYMAGFGITVTGDASARICRSVEPPFGGAIATSGTSLLLLDNEPPSNSTYVYHFEFSTLVNNVSFYRTEIRADSTGPAWTAFALASDDTVLASVGEGTTFAPEARLFELNVANISRIRFETDNTSARTYNTPPIDDFSFQPVPEPGSLALMVAAGFASIVGVFVRRRNPHRS